MSVSFRRTKSPKTIQLFSALTITAIGIGYVYSASQATTLVPDNTAYQYVIGTEQKLDQSLARHALGYGAERGLQLSGDFEQDLTKIEMVVQTTRSGWNSILRAEVSPEAIETGYDANQQVIVVVMRGEVDWGKGPGLPIPQQISPAILDNLYIVMDAETGRRIGSAAFNPGQQLPFYPEGVVAGGIVARYQESPDTSSVLPPPPPG